jgi:hypothetical protein
MLISMSGAAVVALMIGVPQLIGLAASLVVRNSGARLWVGPLVAGAAFAFGWWFCGAAPVRDAAAQGQRTCGAAGALLIVPLLFVTPANVVVGLLMQGLVNVVESRRRRSRANRSLKPASLRPAGQRPDVGG